MTATLKEIGEWESIAADVLAGKWRKADGSQVKALHIGLNAIGTKPCRQAIEKLSAITAAKGKRK